jgi:CBS domain containing-hemolysin-like protein
MVKLLFFFLVSIIFSFLCSIWEAVILSISPTYVKRIQKEKPKIGKWLHQFKKDIDRPLSAILTLNTIAHTVGAIGVGVQAGRIFGSHQINFFVFELTYESLVAGLMTLAILILSEIIPKTLGANYWKQLMPFTVHSLRILLVVLAPFVWISKLITRLIKNDKERSVFSRADVEAMAEVGLESGAIDKEEKSIIQNLLRLENLKVKDIMTPRSVVLAVDETLTLSEIYKDNRPMAYSRIPVYKDQSENITGLILKDGILEYLAEDRHTEKAAAIKRDILFVEDEYTVAKLMDTLILKRQHLAMVADQYGTVVGLVTMEDLFETLLGLEIVDESDKVEDLQKLAREEWEKKSKK